MGFKAQLMTALDLTDILENISCQRPLLPGVVELLYDLRKYEIPIAIVTDLTSNIQMRKMTYFHFEETFDAFVTSEEVGADKPDKRNFELVLKEIKTFKKIA